MVSGGLNRMKVKVLVAQLCPTLCDPMDCSLPGSFAHEILQARILKWIAIPSPGDLSGPGIEPGSLMLQVDSLLSEPPGVDDTTIVIMILQSVGTLET